MQMTRAQKRADSDERILQAAAIVFGRMGYSHATLTGIAEEAGVSQGLVSQRFGSKENLLYEVFKQTQILSFYDEESLHLPQAFYVLLDHLKKEAKEEPEWFEFLSMIHTGMDTPRGFDELTKKQFEETPLHSAIIEAQKQNDLPAGNPWDIFRVFFRNATNLIGWYHKFGLPMPDNESFLYAIQYNRRQKEAEAMLTSQKHEICSLQADRDILIAAVSDIYPLIVYSNLSQNDYYMLQYENFTTKRAKEQGGYDELIQVGASTIPSEIHRNQFLSTFGRENVIRAYKEGKQQLRLRHLQTGDDGVIRWIETQALFKGCECGEIITITLSKPIDDEMNRLRRYGEALQEAEIAANAKARFISNLSHDVRTPMNIIMGFTDIIRRKADDPNKVREYSEKMRASEEELMELLSRALEAGNLSTIGSGIKTKINIKECCGGIIANATELAKQRGVSLEYQSANIRADYIYADEIRMQKNTISLMVKAINESPAGSTVHVKLEQLEDSNPEEVNLKLTISNKGIGLNDELVQHIINNDNNAEGVAMDLKQIKDNIKELGGTIEFSSQNNENIVVCEFQFKK